MQKSYEINDDDMLKYLRRWERRDQNGSSKSTRQRSQEALRKFCKFLDEEGVESYEAVEYEDMEDFLDFLLDSSSHLTAKGLFSPVRVFLQRQDIEAADDVDLSELGDETLIEQHIPDGIQYLEIDEHKQMLEACESLREKLICQLLWATGVRRSEAVDIEMRHFDWDEQRIEINNAKVNGWRTVYYGNRLDRLLRKWRNYGRSQYKYADESDYLLCTNHSTQVQSKYPNEVVKRVADRAGLLESYATDSAGRDLYKPTAHSYRHSYAVHRVREGINLKFLAELMGHNSVETTADNYLQFKQKDIKEADRRYRPKF